MTRVRLFVLIGLVATAGAGCATTRAEVPRERPALDVPVPPPRVITPLPPPEPLPVEPVGNLPGNSAPSPPRPRPQRPPETAKPETKPEETKPPEQNPQGQTPLVPQLRTPDVGNPALVTQQVRDTISRARAVLENIDYGPLSDTRKKVYDDAKLFANQAEEALKGNNLVAAKELAEKAERLAKELQGR
jgi:hypothetical protein